MEKYVYKNKFCFLDVTPLVQPSPNTILLAILCAKSYFVSKKVYYALYILQDAFFCHVYGSVFAHLYIFIPTFSQKSLSQISYPYTLEHHVTQLWSFTSHMHLLGHSVHTYTPRASFKYSHHIHIPLNVHITHKPLNVLITYSYRPLRSDTHIPLNVHQHTCTLFTHLWNLIECTYTFLSIHVTCSWIFWPHTLFRLFCLLLSDPQILPRLFWAVYLCMCVCICW